MNDIATAATPPPPPSPNTTTLPQGLLAWMSFFAIMNMIGGALNIITCVGIPLGIFMLIGGLALMKAKSALEAVDEVPANLQVFFDQLKTFLVMMGILCIITILLSLLMGLIMAIAPLFLAPLYEAFSQGGF